MDQELDDRLKKIEIQIATILEMQCKILADINNEPSIMKQSLYMARTREFYIKEISPTLTPLNFLIPPDLKKKD